MIGGIDADRHYHHQCEKQAGENVHFIGNIDHNSEMLKSAYRAKKVFVQPSWLETPGISALEASLLRCNLVITNRSSTKEYFKEMVVYCDPSSLVSIKNGTKTAMDKDKTKNVSKYILENCMWEPIARGILNVYEKSLVLHER